MHDAEVQSIEIELFIETMLRRRGYDFRHYARNSFCRRVRHLAVACGSRTIAEMIPRLIHDDAFAVDAISRLSVPVSEMFRDPLVFRAIREHIVPVLGSFPRINIWHAGCARGEEAYSMAILLAEAGLLDRTQIYATDINDVALQEAEEGVYPLHSLAVAERNYERAGGCGRLTDHCSVEGATFRMSASLRDRVLFAHHNLVTDGVFCEFQAVFCRNVLIYFDEVLQRRVLHLFRDSLARGGVLCLGARETVRGGAGTLPLTAVDAKLKIYRRTEGVAA